MKKIIKKIFQYILVVPLYILTYLFLLTLED